MRIMKIPSQIKAIDLNGMNCFTQYKYEIQSNKTHRHPPKALNGRSCRLPQLQKEPCDIVHRRRLCQVHRLQSLIWDKRQQKQLFRLPMMMPPSQKATRKKQDRERRA